MPAPNLIPTPTGAQLQRGSYPYCGRLSVYQTGVTDVNQPYAGPSSQLNFPAMPDGIDLARSVDYTVITIMSMPDGFHQYKATNPLTIPISFKLHAFDKEYCPNGALSVLQAAALLHSFTLPQANDAGQRQFVTTTQANPDATPDGNANSLISRSQGANTVTNVTTNNGATFAAPAALRMDLLAIDTNTPGIVCVGYLKDVKVRLLGPFLRGPNNSYNLPTAGEFEFTFVHVPGYNNNFNLNSNSAQQQALTSQAFADTVQKKLYYTADLPIIDYDPDDTNT